VYISGALHGDEVIGPNAAYYLIEYLLSGYERGDTQARALLRNREIIITPMTNAVGYYHHQREEIINKNVPEFINNPHKTTSRSKGSFDINRDFPYNT
jgi:predicted deacylase